MGQDISHMSQSEKSLRKELLEARANVQRQIEILQGVSEYERSGAPWMQAPRQVTELRATLKEIEDALADLGEDDAQRH